MEEADLNLLVSWESHIEICHAVDGGKMSVQQTSVKHIKKYHICLNIYKVMEHIL